MATTTTAMPTASAKPMRKTTPSSTTSAQVSGTSHPCSALPTRGFSTMWAVASAVESVIVMRKSVTAKPSSTSTSSFDHQYDSSRSSMATEPSPCGLSRATRR